MVIHMIKVIVEKYYYEEWQDMKMIRTFKHKGIKYILFTLYWKIRGYDVTEVKE